MRGPKGSAAYAGEPPEGSRPLSQSPAKFMHSQCFCLPTQKDVDGSSHVE